MSVVSIKNVSTRKKDFEAERDGSRNNKASLSMLAEVASQKFEADNDASRASDNKRKKQQKQIGMPIQQARLLSGNQLLRTFSRLEGDEIRRLFSYQCLLLPKTCSVRFESFGSEAKARNLIKEHLLSHLEELPEEGITLKVPCRKKKDEPYKRVTTIPEDKTIKRAKFSKPHESEVLEISEVPNDVFMANVIESPINSSCVEFQECYENVIETPALLPNIHQAPDHDYVHMEQTSDEIKEEFPGIEAIWVKNEEDAYPSTGIVEYEVISEDCSNMLAVSNEVIIKTEYEDSSLALPEKTIMIKSDELPVLQDNRLLSGEQLYEEGNIERDEHRLHKKPKGKAKFIGQSAAEKEKAVRMIEAMKLKQGGTEPLECHICVPPRVFTAPTTLITHYRSHAGIKPYECPLCKGVFTRQHSLNYHMLIHNNETRFTCNDCGRKFRHPSHFREHQRKHTGEAPFECSDCSIRFKTRNTYKRHLKTRHGKVLTQTGGIIILSEEEFRRVKTAPRSLQGRVSNDKENNRRPKNVSFPRRNKQKKVEGEKGENCDTKFNLSGNWSTNLLEPEAQAESTPEQVQTVAILQTLDGASCVSIPATVMLVSLDKSMYNKKTPTL